MRIRVRMRPASLEKCLRLLALAAGTALLSYAAWATAIQIVHQRSVSSEFEDQRTEARSRPANSRILPAEPFPAKLTIARLGLNVMVEEGIGAGTLRKAAGHIPGTASPGHTGNVGLAAHRDTLFRGLKDIRKQDVIRLSTVDKDYVYQVSGLSIVKPAEVSVLRPLPGEKTLTLVTCYPFNFVGRAPYRFIVHADQIAEAGIK